MRRLIKSFSFAIDGIFFCFQKERNFLWHSLAALVAIITGFLFKISKLEWAAILLCIALVVSLEMINTAIEILCNKITREKDNDIRMIKDISAGAVLVGAVLALVCGLVIFLPKIHALI
ncbi:MAG: diacylglycerol kinase family protein [Ferruginibacter sp.]